MPPNRLEPLEIVSRGRNYFTVKFENVDNQLVLVPREMLGQILDKDQYKSLLEEFEDREKLEEAIKRSLRCHTKPKVNKEKPTRRLRARACKLERK